MVDPNLQTALISFGTSFLTAYATRENSAPMQTLDDLWELAFGGFHLFVQKKKVLWEKNFTDFKRKIMIELNNTPDENLQEPPLNIIGSAFEATKFFIEEEVIRNMFAKTIVASMDNRKSSQVHNSYIEIIKQLSPLDAQNLLLLKTGSKPIAQYRLNNIENEIHKLVKTNLFLSNLNTQDIDLNAISLSNLTRLGLSSITYDSYIPDLSVYSDFEEIEEYKKLLQYTLELKTGYETFSDNKKAIEGITQKFGKDAPDNLKYHSLEIKKGLIELTPLGKSFVAICCGE